MRVYIAGPMTNGGRATDNEIEFNIAAGVMAGLEALRLGHAVYIPHLAHYINDIARMIPVGAEDWLQSDFNWISVSHVVLRLPGDSEGADREEVVAKRAGVLWLKIDNAANVKSALEYAATEL